MIYIAEFNLKIHAHAALLHHRRLEGPRQGYRKLVAGRGAHVTIVARNESDLKLAVEVIGVRFRGIEFPGNVATNE